MCEEKRRFKVYSGLVPFGIDFIESLYYKSKSTIIRKLISAEADLGLLQHPRWSAL